MTAAPPTDPPVRPARRRPAVAPWARTPAWRALRRAVAFSVALLRGLSARPLASYYLLVASAGLLLVIGLTMVFSATSVEAYVADGNAFTQIQKQGLLAGLGLVAFWGCQRLPVRTYRALAKPFLIAAFAMVIALDVLALLASAGVLADPRFGPLRADELWLYLGPLQIQPSEFAKLALALWVADVLVRKGEQAGAWKELSRPLFPVAGLLLVLVGYNDLGTMLTACWCCSSASCGRPASGCGSSPAWP